MNSLFNRRNVPAAVRTEPRLAALMLFTFSLDYALVYARSPRLVASNSASPIPSLAFPKFSPVSVPASNGEQLPFDAN